MFDFVLRNSAINTMKNKEIFLSCVLYKTIAALQKTLYTSSMLSARKTDGFSRNITLTTKENT